MPVEPNNPPKTLMSACDLTSSTPAHTKRTPTEIPVMIRYVHLSGLVALSNRSTKAICSKEALYGGLAIGCSALRCNCFRCDGFRKLQFKRLLLAAPALVRPSSILILRKNEPVTGLVSGRLYPT